MSAAEKLAAVLAELLAPHAANASPSWRTLQAEAAARGLSKRSLTELCRKHAVEIRGRGKFASVRTADLDALFDKMPTAGVDDFVRATMGARRAS